jgi:hypothetical protein
VSVWSFPSSVPDEPRETILCYDPGSNVGCDTRVSAGRILSVKPFCVKFRRLHVCLSISGFAWTSKSVIPYIHQTRCLRKAAAAHTLYTCINRRREDGHTGLPPVHTPHGCATSSSAALQSRNRHISSAIQLKMPIWSTKSRKKQSPYHAARDFAVRDPFFYQNSTSFWQATGLGQREGDE